MGQFSVAKLFGITIRESATDGSDFTNPDADYRRLFLGEDGLLHVKDSAGAVTDPYTSTGGGTDPWLIDVSLLYGSHGNTNWSTFQLDGNEIDNGDMESSGAQNDEIYWDIGVSAGTWDIDLLHRKGANRGIYTVSIDGSSVGTIDGYNASNQYNQHTVLTGVSISGGQRRLKLKMATKNGSSSSYFGTAQHIQLRRTA